MKRYYYQRFRWSNPVNLKVAYDKLKETFRVGPFPTHRPHSSFLVDNPEEIRVTADTLMALLSPFRAILNQREAKPFTAKDMELRTAVFDMYPRTRPTPLPMLFGKEPKFNVEH
jgi:hypothetical protein